VENMKVIGSIINIVIAAGLGYLKIRKAVKGNGTVEEKKAAVIVALQNVLDKLQAFAKSTDATWDDSLVEVFADQLEGLADLLVSELGK